MRLIQGVLLLGAVALGNPVAELQDRQAPAASACSTLAGRCTRVASLRSSASAFCGSLGIGTLINTVTTTVVVRRTTTFTAPTSTSTITSDYFFGCGFVIYDYFQLGNDCAARCTGSCAAFDYYFDGASVFCETMAAVVSVYAGAECDPSSLWGGYLRISTRAATTTTASRTSTTPARITSSTPTSVRASVTSLASVAISTTARRSSTTFTSSPTRAAASSSTTAGIPGSLTTSSMVASSGSSSTSRSPAAGSTTAGVSSITASTRISATFRTTTSSATTQTITSAASAQSMGLGCSNPDVTTMTYGSIASAYNYCIGARLLYPRTQDGDGYGVFVDSVNDCASRCTGLCRAFNYDGAYGDSDRKFCELMPSWTGANPSQPGSYYRTAYALRSTSTVTITSTAEAGLITELSSFEYTATSQVSSTTTASSVPTQTPSSPTTKATTTPPLSTSSTVLTTDRCPMPTRIEVTTSSIVTAYDSCNGFMDSLDASLGYQNGVTNIAQCAARCTGSCVAFDWSGVSCFTIGRVRALTIISSGSYTAFSIVSTRALNVAITTTQSSTTQEPTTSVQSTTFGTSTSASIGTPTTSSSATSSSADTSIPLSTSATTPAITQAPRGPGCPTPTRTEITQTGIATLYDYCNAYMAQNAPVGNVYEWRIPRDACAARCTGDCFAFNYLVDGGTTSCQTITASVSTVREYEYSWRAYSQVGTRIVTGPEASATLDKFLGCANPSRTTFSQSQIATVYNYCTGSYLQYDPGYSGQIYAVAPGDPSRCAALCTDQPYGCQGFNYVDRSTTAECHTLRGVWGETTGVASATAYQFVSTSTLPGVTSTTSARAPAVGLVDGLRLARRHDDAQPIEKRQAASSVKPACLAATNAMQTTAACKCIIPSPTVTTATTIRATSTSIKIVVTTRRMIKSSTFTPTTSVTVYPDTVISKTRVITSVRRMTVISPTTVAWALASAATPTAFYIMGGDNGDLHARWHTEDDDHLGNIDFNQPGYLDASLFSLDGNGKLGLTGFSDDTDVYPVRGELVSHPDHQLMIMQAADDGSGEPTTCSIDGTKDGMCRMSCKSGEFRVNEVQGGSWTMWQSGAVSDSGFTKYIYAVEDPWEWEVEGKRKKSKK
ncbi:uncharacterized protein MYCGRDRAFT_110285 [Zymoseptoria tritici IPO323]|uniref:Apple domain-containing protein n=1 Tax=Zymoseptoria tritici (strain CBS 115943 / IPO323) TaxID=336722 RepID=F9XGM1_ZYMTI|nr:uncharacterized protein MYCGRDRAFT_110285 [Zymoseptoria tritici IPO323]EGP86012.1 hypothetical protein MYCGRDRAFT_110285 [Zymoseptoria tritici IPO323]